MNQIIVQGKASGKIFCIIPVTNQDYHLNLMDFLLNNGVPVASSCKGEGQCKKCVLVVREGQILSCQKIVQDLFTTNHEAHVTFSYL